MTISFVIPVRNDAAHLRRCLASISASAGPAPCDVVVVDNGSTDESAAVARMAGARVISRPNHRVAALRNAGAAAATGSLLAFVDADHEIDRRWVEAAHALFERPDIAAAGAPYRPPEESTWVQRTYDHLRRHAESTAEEVDWLPSGNLIVRRHVFESIGGFDERLDTCEDVDLSQRLRRRGARIVASDRLTSIHRGDPATLRALFFGELWRGRDNLRVSLRDLTLPSAPSLAIPLLYLAGAAASVLGLATWAAGGWRLAAAGAALLGALVLLRTLLLLRRGRGRSPKDAVEAVLVGTVYDTARALALVAPVGHALRRKS